MEVNVGMSSLFVVVGDGESDILSVLQFVV